MNLLSFSWLDQGVAYLLESIFNLSMESRLGSSLHFFIYDSIKILILLSIMIFVISYIRSYFPPERTKGILTRFKGITGNILASTLGIVTPFCSCSSVPIFIGFVEAGVPLGLTFSFLITSPIVNEAAFVILLGLFGLKFALFYVLTGVVVGVLGGYIIGRLKLEHLVEPYIYELDLDKDSYEKLTRRERFDFAKDAVIEIVQRIWIYLLIGIGIGALIHGWAPQELLSTYASKDNPLAVFVAVILGIPLYSNAIGTIPIAEALISKGVGVGTAMAFMMATTALSLPEAILLKKAIKPKLIGIFIGITGTAILLVGYLFNALAHLLI